MFPELDIDITSIDLDAAVREDIEAAQISTLIRSLSDIGTATNRVIAADNKIALLVPGHYDEKDILWEAAKLLLQHIIHNQFVSLDDRIRTAFFDLYIELLLPSYTVWRGTVNSGQKISIKLKFDKILAIGKRLFEDNELLEHPALLRELYPIWDYMSYQISDATDQFSDLELDRLIKYLNISQLRSLRLNTADPYIILAELCKPAYSKFNPITTELSGYLTAVERYQRVNTYTDLQALIDSNRLAKKIKDSVQQASQYRVITKDKIFSYYRALPFVTIYPSNESSTCSTANASQLKQLQQTQSSYNDILAAILIDELLLATNHKITNHLNNRHRMTGLSACIAANIERLRNMFRYATVEQKDRVTLTLLQAELLLMIYELKYSKPNLTSNALDMNAKRIFSLANVASQQIAGRLWLYIIDEINCKIGDRDRHSWQRILKTQAKNQQRIQAILTSQTEVPLLDKFVQRLLADKRFTKANQSVRELLGDVNRVCEQQVITTVRKHAYTDDELSELFSDKPKKSKARQKAAKPTELRQRSLALFASMAKPPCTNIQSRWKAFEDVFNVFGDNTDTLADEIKILALQTKTLYGFLSPLLNAPPTTTMRFERALSQLPELGLTGKHHTVCLIHLANWLEKSGLAGKKSKANSDKVMAIYQLLLGHCMTADHTDTEEHIIQRLNPLIKQLRLTLTRLEQAEQARTKVHTPVTANHSLASKAPARKQATSSIANKKKNKKKKKKKPLPTAGFTIIMPHSDVPAARTTDTDDKPTAHPNDELDTAENDVPALTEVIALASQQPEYPAHTVDSKAVKANSSDSDSEPGEVESPRASKIPVPKPPSARQLISASPCSPRNSTQISGSIILPDSIKTIMNAIERAGFCIYIFGGYLRDYVLKLEPRDVDFVTNMPFEQLQTTLLDNRINCSNGINRAMVMGNTTVNNRDFPFDISSYPALTEHDILFKCGVDTNYNGLFCNSNGKLYDPFQILHEIRTFAPVRIISPHNEPIVIIRAMLLAIKLDMFYPPHCNKELKVNQLIIQFSDNPIKIAFDNSQSAHALIYLLGKLCCDSPDYILECLFKIGIFGPWLPNLHISLNNPCYLKTVKANLKQSPKQHFGDIIAAFLEPFITQPSVTNNNVKQLFKLYFTDRNRYCYALNDHTLTRIASQLDKTQEYQEAFPVLSVKRR